VDFPNYLARSCSFMVQIVKILRYFRGGERWWNDEIVHSRPFARTKAIYGPQFAFAENFKLEAAVDVENHSDSSKCLSQIFAPFSWSPTPWKNASNIGIISDSSYGEVSRSFGR